MQISIHFFLILEYVCYCKHFCLLVNKIFFFKTIICAVITEVMFMKTVLRSGKEALVKTQTNQISISKQP